MRKAAARDPEAGAHSRPSVIASSCIERIKSAGLEAPAPEDERLLKEVVYFADRSDISEELTRLQSHFQQFDDCAEIEGAGGPDAGFSGAGNEPRDQHDRLQGERRLISREVVTLKAELEKFREQAQNVE